MPWHPSCLSPRQHSEEHPAPGGVIGTSTVAFDPADKTSVMTDAPVVSGATDDVSTAQKTGADRRQFRRLRPDELSHLGARLTSGAEIKLIDLSRGGAQFECDRRFLPNSTISLRLVTTDSAFVVNGRVVRSRIVRLAKGGLGYNVAVAFNETLQDLIAESDDVPAAPPTPMPPVTSLPVDASQPQARMPVTDVPEVIDDQQTDELSDVTDDERAAFEASVEDAPMMLTVTAAVEHTDEELRDLFNGNDW